MKKRTILFVCIVVLAALSMAAYSLSKMTQVTNDISLEEISCQLCGRANLAKNRFCEHCGSFLSRFKFFVED